MPTQPDDTSERVPMTADEGISNNEQPNRRPIARLFRATATGVTRWCVARGIHPDWISYGSVVAASIAAMCFVLSGRSHVLLLLAAAMCALRLWCNMLDGMVAISSGKTSARGEIVNELPDRISDVLIFAGIANSPWCSEAAGYWAAIFALLVAYVGIIGQTVGAPRQFGGIMSKPWRMVVVIVASVILFSVLAFDASPLSVPPATSPFPVFTIACWIVVAGSIQTIIIRVQRIMRSLTAQS